MIAEAKAAIGAVAKAMFFVLGLSLGLLGGGVAVRLYDNWSVIPAAEKAATERADAGWKSALATAEKLAEDDRRRADEEIRAAEIDLISKDAVHASQMTALERALEQEKAHAPTPTPTAGPPGACSSSIPRSVRDALQSIGRSPARPHSAKSDGAVRAGG